MKKRIIFIAGFAAFVALFLTACNITGEETENTATVYYSSGCPCCEEHARYLEAQGYSVDEIVSRPELNAYRQQIGIETDALSCHITEIDGYFAEGHVPVEVMEKMKEQEPDIAGVAIPGMPAHAPGMGEPIGEYLEVKAISHTGNIEGIYTEVEW